jgi:hypothetical protein
MQKRSADPEAGVLQRSVLVIIPMSPPQLNLSANETRLQAPINFRFRSGSGLLLLTGLMKRPTTGRLQRVTARGREEPSEPGIKRQVFPATRRIRDAWREVSAAPPAELIPPQTARMSWEANCAPHSANAARSPIGVSRIAGSAGTTAEFSRLQRCTASPTSSPPRLALSARVPCSQPCSPPPPPPPPEDPRAGDSAGGGTRHVSVTANSGSLDVTAVPASVADRAS